MGYSSWLKYIPEEQIAIDDKTVIMTKEYADQLDTYNNQMQPTNPSPGRIFRFPAKSKDGGVCIVELDLDPKYVNRVGRWLEIV